MTAARLPAPSHRPLAVFAAAALAVYAAGALVLDRLAGGPRPDVLGAAVTLDLTVFVPLLFYAVVVRRCGWPVLSVLPVFALSLVAAGRMVPAPYHATLDLVRLALPLAEAAVLGLVVVRGSAVARAYRASGVPDFYDRLRGALAAGVGGGPAAGVLAYEVALARYALAGWRARAPEGPDLFTGHRRSGYGAVLAGLLLAAAAEGVGVHVLLVRWSPTAAAVHLALSLYAVAWLLGDWHALRLRPIVVDAGGLTLRAGLRWSVRVPWADVADLRRLEGPSPGKAPGYLDLSPLGGARYIVDLRRPLRVEGPYGIGRVVTRLGFRVDERERFERRLAETAG